MDEEKSTCQGTVCSEDSDQTDSSAKANVRLAEGIDPSISQGANINAEGEDIKEQFLQETMFQIGPVLDDNNRRRKSNSLDDISIKPLALKPSMSLINMSSANSRCNVKTQGDLTHYGLHPQNMSPAFKSSETENMICVCSDENTIFNNADTLSYPTDFLGKSGIVKNHEHIMKQSTEMRTESTEVKQNINLTEVANKVEAPMNEEKNEQVLCNMGEEKSFSPVKISTKTYNSTRPTLADDSRLVKISLPTNPIHLMHSNTQFLNKSRNFLHFITEKSTNIMEKALLPQQLAGRCNSVLKTIDSIYGERKFAEVPLPDMEQSAMNKAYSSNDDTNDIKCITSSNVANIKTAINDFEMECTTGTERKSNLEDLSSEKSTTYEQLKTDLPAINNGCTVMNDTLTIPQDNGIISSTITDTNGVGNIENNNILHKDNDPNIYAETNGNSSEVSEWIVSHLENKNADSKYNASFETDTLNDEQLNTNFENPKQGLLQHPAYLTLLKDYADLKARSLKLQERVELLEERNHMLEAEKSGEIFKVQIETLEKTVDRLASELRTALAGQEVLKKEYNVANKERESMVMKYAIGEKQLIDVQRTKECAERKVKEITKEQELLQNKLRQVQGERTRICNILDGKCREITELQKEVERLKEDVKMRDVKLKWTQNKLKTEMDMQKETQQKLDKATTRINEMKEECEQVRKEAQESMRKFQQSEENKAVTLDQQLKEQQARLILERHVTEDKEMLRLQLQKEVELLKQRQQTLIEENNTLSLNIQELEKDRLNYENNFSNLKIIADQRQKEIVDLLNKVSQLETLRLHLQHKDQCLKTTETEMGNLRLANEELQSDMRVCRQREADLLDFTRKLTDKNVRLQSEFTEMESKMKQLEKEYGPLHERINELIAQVKSLEKSLLQEQKTRIEECEILATHLAEQTQLAQNLAQQLEDSQGENAVLKRKQQISIKELTRELQQCRKRLEEFEAASPCNSLDITSRTGSNVSLNTGDTLNGALSDNSNNGDQSVEPSKQDMMMQRIIKLQKVNVKRAEKIDFLEEHNRILVEELQKKTRIIQNYILHENFGAMGNNERDRHKAELARHGGIMASLYNQRVSDDNMTLELSLEINQKLQAVLEDVLLKNITLKSNIDTLGEEIARLTMQNQQRHVKN